MTGLTVLSLFDGISGGQQALKELGIPIKAYYASEIDKSAIAITQKNHPNTIQLGDVRAIKASDLPKIDLLLAGSPCTGFSKAGKRLNFEDPQSFLFFEFLRLYRELEPTRFLLENVKMQNDWLYKISDYVSIQGVPLNSNCFSPQTRLRYYWTNLKFKPRKRTCKLTIANILEPNYDNLLEQSRYQYHPITHNPTNNSTHILGGLLTTTETPRAMPIKTLSDLRSHQRVMNIYGKSLTLTTQRIGFISMPLLLYIRQLTMLELERLQTFPDGYTSCVNKTARRRALGNSWNVATIKHILKSL